MTFGPRRPTVLLVEDHTDSRQMYAEFLRADYDVIEAADGVAALEAIEQRLPDVVVTDLALPRMGGLELARRLREDARLAGLVIIALSGYSSSEADTSPGEGGFDLVLEKPCLPETLAEDVARLSSGRKDQR